MSVGKHNDSGLTFDAWLAMVDQEVRRLAGVSVHDLADFRSWDAWADDQDPTDVATEQLAEEGFPFAAFDQEGA